jgi:hypothetical protein
MDKAGRFAMGALAVAAGIIVLNFGATLVAAGVSALLDAINK